MKTEAMPDSRDRVFVRKFLLAFFAVVVLVIAFNFAMDPYFCYRKTGLISYFSFDQTSSPTWKFGLVKQNQGHDSIWVGSSLSSHLNINYLNERMGINCFAGIQAAGRPNIYEKFIANTLKKNNLKYVFYETYLSHWCFERMGLEFDESFISDYIMTDSILDDWEYLLSRKITTESWFIFSGMLQNYLHVFMKNKLGLNKEDISRKTDNIMPADALYSTRSLAKKIPTNKYYWPYDTTVCSNCTQNGLENIDKYIAPLLVENAETQFVFVIPPTGVILKAIFYNGGLLEEYLTLSETIFKKLLSYPNAKIVACDLDYAYNTNTDNYLDDAHYEPSGGKMMVDCIVDGKYEITLGNMDERMQEYRNMVQTFVWPFLRPGFSGYQVADLQAKLARLGYRVAVNGFYDSATESAVREFQENSCIEPDGMAFSDTIDRLTDAYNQITQSDEL